MKMIQLLLIYKSTKILYKIFKTQRKINIMKKITKKVKIKACWLKNEEK